MRNEQTIHQLLSSLSLCERPTCAIEVIVIIYSFEGDGSEVNSQNKRTLASCHAWNRINDNGFRILAHRTNAFPSKSKAQSLALKLGMDEALQRYALLGKEQGIDQHTTIRKYHKCHDSSLLMGMGTEVKTR